MNNKSINKSKKSFKRIFKHKFFRKRNVFSLFSLILLIIFIIFISIIDIIPTKYFFGISFILILINMIGIILINVHKKIVLKIVGVIILMASIFGSVIGIYYLNSTNKFFKKSFESKDVYIKNTYYVLSKKSNNLKETDITGSIATYKETINLTKALEKLSIKYKVKEQQYDDLDKVFQALNTNTTSFLLIEKASYEIIFSIDTNMHKEDYQILYEFDVFTKKKASKSTNTNKFNIFIGGTDFAGLMDFNMIISINLDSHKVLLTSIPRDYYIEVPNKDGRYDKLSFMNAYGPNVNKEALENLFGIKIDYSVTLNTTSLVTVVDYVGGIEFCSDYAYTTTHALVSDTYNDKNNKKLTIEKGCQHLNGIETLTVARERNAFPGRDRVRQQNCQQIILALFKKLINTDTILHYNETLNTLGSLYETDIPKEVITNFFKDILNNGNKWQITTQSVDGVDDHDKVHLSNMIDWVMHPTYETVEQASTKIKELIK